MLEKDIENILEETLSSSSDVHLKVKTSCEFMPLSCSKFLRVSSIGCSVLAALIILSFLSSDAVTTEHV